MHWVASLVAETHRILTRGGVFHVPVGLEGPDESREAAVALRGESDRPISSSRRVAWRAPARQRMLDVVPDSLHQRIAFVFGAARRGQRIEKYHRENNEPELMSRRSSQPAGCSAPPPI